jgi:hypothetical protein
VPFSGWVILAELYWITLAKRPSAGEHVDTLRNLLRQEVGALAIDLKSVSLVDREAVEFLALTEYNGTELRNCPAYVREWVTRERAEMDAERPDLPRA